MKTRTGEDSQGRSCTYRSFAGVLRPPSTDELLQQNGPRTRRSLPETYKENILKRRKEGVPVPVLAEQYGVTEDMIQNVCR